RDLRSRAHAQRDHRADDRWADHLGTLGHAGNAGRDARVAAVVAPVAQWPPVTPHAARRIRARAGHRPARLGLRALGGAADDVQGESGPSALAGRARKSTGKVLPSLNSSVSRTRVPGTTGATACISIR